MSKMQQGSLAHKAYETIGTTTKKAGYSARQVQIKVALANPKKKFKQGQIAQALINLYRKSFISRETRDINGIDIYIYYPFDGTAPIMPKGITPSGKKVRPKSKRGPYRVRKNPAVISSTATFANGDTKPSVVELAQELNAPTKHSIAVKFLKNYAERDSFLLDVTVAHMKTMTIDTLMADAGLTALEISILIQGD